MLIIPAFELGLWNAWIFVLPILAVMIFGVKILRGGGSEGDPNANKRGEIIGSIDMIIRFVFFVYSVFLPLRIDTIWFVFGLIIYLIVIFFLSAALWSFNSTPTNELVTKGVYGISRNPMHVGLILANLSIGLTCLSWVFLLLAIVDFLLLRYYVVNMEEPYLNKKHGNAYREYMKRTPRWIGIPRSEK